MTRRFVDDANSPTEAYPFNPNGSPDGIAGLCSEDGRHLAVMPHPERCFLTWQVGPGRNVFARLFVFLRLVACGTSVVPVWTG